jgi:hypothetical protein
MGSFQSSFIVNPPNAINGYRYVLVKERCYSHACKEQKHLCHLMPMEIQQYVIFKYFNKCRHCETYWSPKLTKCECCGRKLSLSKHIKKREKVYY